MALYLVQHGQSIPKDVDAARPLSEEGRETVARIAGVAAGYNVHVSRIRHSGKTRAQQTAEIMASQINPAGGIAAMAGLDPLDDVAEVAGGIYGNEDLMLVGISPPWRGSFRI